MATTFEVFAGRQPASYSSLPTKDVEILAGESHCRTCGEVVEPDPDRFVWRHGSGQEDHPADPRPKCRYCNNDQGIIHRQGAWHDEWECPRCGGIYGFAIGD